jgi:hypothetical protein
MSIFGTKNLWMMSALPPKADIPRDEQHVGFVPQADREHL